MAKSKSKTTKFRTVEELLAAGLREGSVVISGLGTAWQLSTHGNWVAASDTPLGLDPNYDEDFQLVYVPVGDWG